MPFQSHKHIHRKVQFYKQNQLQVYGSNTGNEAYFSHRITARGIAFKCELCDTAIAPGGMFHLENHCASKVHLDRVRHLATLQENPVALKCSLLQLQADEIGSKQLQVELQNKIYWILLENEPIGAVRGMLADAERWVNEWEQNEKMMVLDLAIWKATCIASLSTKDIARMKNCHDLLDWYENEWKARKTESRNGNEISILLKMVLPFIGSMQGHS